MSQSKLEKKAIFIPHLDCLELLDYGVDPDCVTGGFRTPIIPQSLVREFSELHIMTALDTRRFANRYVPDCPWYFVSTGNSDPTIEWTVRELTMDDIRFITDIMRGDGSSKRRERLADGTELMLLKTIGYK